MARNNNFEMKPFPNFVVNEKVENIFLDNVKNNGGIINEDNKGNKIFTDYEKTLSSDTIRDISISIGLGGQYSGFVERNNDENKYGEYAGAMFAVTSGFANRVQSLETFRGYFDQKKYGTENEIKHNFELNGIYRDDEVKADGKEIKEPFKYYVLNDKNERMYLTPNVVDTIWADVNKATAENQNAKLDVNLNTFEKSKDGTIELTIKDDSNIYGHRVFEVAANDKGELSVNLNADDMAHWRGFDREQPSGAVERVASIKSTADYLSIYGHRNPATLFMNTAGMMEAYSSGEKYNGKYVTPIEIVTSSFEVLSSINLTSIAKMAIVKVIASLMGFRNQMDVEKYREFGTLDDAKIATEFGPGALKDFYDEHGIEKDVPLIFDVTTNDNTPLIESKPEDNKTDVENNNTVEKNTSNSNETQKVDFSIKREDIEKKAAELNERVRNDKLAKIEKISDGPAKDYLNAVVNGEDTSKIELKLEDIEKIKDFSNDKENGFKLDSQTINFLDKKIEDSERKIIKDKFEAIIGTPVSEENKDRFFNKFEEKCESRKVDVIGILHSAVKLEKEQNPNLGFSAVAESYFKRIDNDDFKDIYRSEAGNKEKDYEKRSDNIIDYIEGFVKEPQDVDIDNDTVEQSNVYDTETSFEDVWNSLEGADTEGKLNSLTKSYGEAGDGIVNQIGAELIKGKSIEEAIGNVAANDENKDMISAIIEKYDTSKDDSIEKQPPQPVDVKSITIEDKMVNDIKSRIEDKQETAISAYIKGSYDDTGDFLDKFITIDEIVEKDENGNDRIINGVFVEWENAEGLRIDEEKFNSPDVKVLESRFEKMIEMISSDKNSSIEEKCEAIGRIAHDTGWACKTGEKAVEHFGNNEINIDTAVDKIYAEIEKVIKDQYGIEIDKDGMVDVDITNAKTVDTNKSVDQVAKCASSFVSGFVPNGNVNADKIKEILQSAVDKGETNTEKFGYLNDAIKDIFTAYKDDINDIDSKLDMIENDIKNDIESDQNDIDLNNNDVIPDDSSSDVSDDEDRID